MRRLGVLRWLMWWYRVRCRIGMGVLLLMVLRLILIVCVRNWFWIWCLSRLFVRRVSGWLIVRMLRVILIVRVVLVIISGLWWTVWLVRLGCRLFVLVLMSVGLRFMVRVCRCWLLVTVLRWVGLRIVVLRLRRSSWLLKGSWSVCLGRYWIRCR